LAQKKHPEALQLYKSYMKRSEDGATPVTSKSRVDDDVEVLLYIAFAYFDWARHTELFNDINAAPADERYKQAMEHLQQAINMQPRNITVLQYNLCMTKLQAANCVLQKLTRNIPRTVEEVDEALTGLIESQKVVEDILKEKEEGGKKINIRSSTLEDFLRHCRSNISSAQSHLEDEKKRAEEEKDDQEIRRRATEIALQEAQLREAIRKSEEAAKQEERDQKAEMMMRKVEDLRSGWQQEQAAAEAAKAKRSKVVENQELEEEDIQQTTRGLFDDSDDESDVPDPVVNNVEDANPVSHGDLFGDTDSEDDVEPAVSKKETTVQMVDDDIDEDVEFEGGTKTADLTNDLFGDTDDESDEELVPSAAKRGHDETNDDGEAQNNKKQRLDDE
jgi:RNA polymerase-associated protein CTR9